MAALRKHWIIGLMTFVLVGGLLTAANIAAQIGQPFGGFFTSRSIPWLVDAPTPPWWPALNSGLRYDDELVEMDGKPYGAGSYRMYAEARNAGKQFVTLTVKRNGERFNLVIPIRTFNLSNLLDLKLPDLLVGLGFWLLGVAVYFARPREAVNRVFAVACTTAAGAVWLTIAALFPQDDWLSHALQVGWVLVAGFVGVAFVHLATLFPEPVQPVDGRWRRWLTVLYLFMAFTIAVYVIGLSLRWQDYESPLAKELSTFANHANVGSFGVAVFAYLARLVQLAWKPNLSRRVRRQVIMLSGGLLLALPYILIVVMRALVRGTQSYFWNGLDLRYLVLAVPLTFAFIILRYQSFKRTPMPIIAVLILASSALVASLGAWVVRSLEPEWVNSLTWTPFAPLFAITLLTSVIWSSQSSWWGAFSRLFQWERRSYGAVRKFGQQVINEIELSQLPQAIAKALVTNMELERAAIWLWNEKESAYQLLGQAGEWPQPPPMRLFPDPLPTTSRSMRIPSGHDVDESEPLPGWLEPLSRSGMIEVVTPLTISGSAIGLLGSGKRWDEEIFDERDLQITELIAQQAGLFLLTALQIEQLRQVPQEIATAQERERFKIAQELHDTVQQFLGRLPFFLEVSRSSARSNPEETEAILKRCIEDVDSAAKAVRQIRNNLAPLQLEKSLSQPLSQLIEHFSTRNNIHVDVSISPEVDTRLSTEARHALYRVVQQALDNIAAHAGASNVTISIEPVQERLHFSITDDGTGFSKAQRAAAEESGSFGLKSMEARITSQGGEFTIQAGAESGTRVNGWLPMLLSATPMPEA